MEVVNNPNFNENILFNLENLNKKPRKDLFKIINLFSDEKIYILGGFVRDSILNVINGYNFPINDLDILVDDSYFRDKTFNFRGYFDQKSISRFGGMKLKYRNPLFSMDIFSMNNILFLNQNPNLEKNLENVLEGVDLTTSAFAYNLDNKEIYGHPLALKSIHNMDVDVLNKNSLISSTISRLITHSCKMKFKLGEKAIDYIKEKYNPELDKEIYSFLNYKGEEHLFPLVKSEINSILRLH